MNGPDDTATERAPLRAERERIRLQEAALLAEGKGVARRQIAIELELYARRLNRHHEAVVAFLAALEDFKVRNGPLD